MASTSGKNTREYRKMIKCTPDLTDVIADDLDTLCPRLVKAKLINNNQRRDFMDARLNAAQNRAANLVGHITNRVNLDTQNFHKFIHVLKEDESTYEEVLKKLQERSNLN